MPVANDITTQDNRNGGSRTFLWCVPRVTSTALTKCLSFIEEIDVWFEPYLYAYRTARDYELATNSVLPPKYDGNEDAYQRAAKCFEDFIKCKLEPRRLS